MFGDIAWFQQARFHKVARFEGAKFRALAYFHETEFSNSALFRVGPEVQAVDFAGPVSFSRATFAGYTTFEGAQFKGPADFQVKKLEQGIEFRNAHFERAPDFIGVDMREPPRLDNMTITPPLILRTADKPDKQPTSRTSWFRQLSFGFAIDGDEHARYRKLRKMAADAKDIEKEVLFNGYEIASRRFWVDQPFGAGWDRFWLGWLYSKLSNYGQSFWRPMSWLVALWLIFACLYAYAGEREPPTPGVETGGPTNGPPRVGSWAYPLFAVGQAAKDELACQPSYEDARTRDAKREKVTDPTTGEEVKDARGEAKTKLVPAQNFQPTNVGWEAAILSARNATLFDRSDLSRRMYGCLYGIQERTHPVIPPSVTLLQTLQTVLSGILLFLAGLAIRNMYRVK